MAGARRVRASRYRHRQLGAVGHGVGGERLAAQPFHRSVAAGGKTVVVFRFAVLIIADKRVADVLASDPKVTEYVRRLEEREPEDEDQDGQSGDIDALPSGEELARELEQFLRDQKRDADSDD